MKTFRTKKLQKTSSSMTVANFNEISKDVGWWWGCDACHIVYEPEDTILVMTNEKESYPACPRKKLFGVCQKRMHGSREGAYYKREYTLENL